MSRIFLVSPLESVFLARGTRSIELANLLAKRGVNLVFITSNFNHERKLAYPIVKVENAFSDVQYDHHIISVPPYLKNISIRRVLTHIVFCTKLLFFLLKNVQKGDCVVTMLSFPELTLVDWLIKKFCGAATILDVWDIWPDAFPFKRSLSFKVFSFYCKLIYSFTLKKYDHLVYVAPSFTKWIEDFAPKVAKSFIPLGFDKDRWAACPVVKNNVFSKNSIDIVYVGYLAYQFDISKVVSSVNSCQNLIFHIIGDGELMNDYKSLSSTNRNIFYGRCDPNRVVEIISRSMIAILPISDESAAFMPNKLFDYLGARIPILSIGKNDSSSFVEGNAIGWIANNNFESIANFFLNISVDEISTKKNRIKEIASNYSKDILYKNYADLIIDELTFDL